MGLSPHHLVRCKTRVRDDGPTLRQIKSNRPAHQQILYVPTSYHPQSNGMVEHFHRQLKAAIMAHESLNPWIITLPTVLLVVRSAIKELLGRSSAEMIYGTTLRLLGEFTEQYTVDAHTDLDNYFDKLRVAMLRLRFCPPRDTPQKDIFQYKELETCSHVFLRRIAIAPLLTAPYDGPYKVISKSSRVIKILRKGKVVTVTIDRIKPAHFEREPESGNITQRQTQPKLTTPKPAAIAQGPRSTHTSQSVRAGVETNMSTQTESLMLNIGTSPAIALQSDTTRARLPRPSTPYKAPQSRTPIVSRANQKSSGLRTYSHVPLHLRGNALDRN